MVAVFVDAEGKDILGADGDYITENDIWIPDQATDPTTGQVVQSDVMVLKRDGVTTQPSAMIWQEKLITRRIIHYVGPKANNVNFLDFLCPIDAESVQDADCVVHLYDKPLMELADSWMRQLPANTTPAQRQEAIRKSTDMLRQLNGGSGQPESVIKYNEGKLLRKVKRTKTKIIRRNESTLLVFSFLREKGG